MTKRYQMASIGATPLTVTVRKAEMVTNSAGRVEVRFNREPSKEEAREKLLRVFDGKIEPVTASFRRIPTKDARVTAFGFIRDLESKLPVQQAETMTQISKNVFMDDADQSIWKIEGSHIVKTAKDDLQDIMDHVVEASNSNLFMNRLETAAEYPVADSLSKQPHLNTRYVCCLDPTTTELAFGAQVSEESVFDRKSRHLVPVARNTLVAYKELNGMDRIYDYEKTKDAVNLATAGESEYASYYAHVYDSQKPYLKMVEEQLLDGAIL